MRVYVYDSVGLIRASTPPHSLADKAGSRQIAGGVFVHLCVWVCACMCVCVREPAGDSLISGRSVCGRGKVGETRSRRGFLTQGGERGGERGEVQGQQGAGEEQPVSHRPGGGPT